MEDSKKVNIGRERDTDADAIRSAEAPDHEKVQKVHENVDNVEHLRTTVEQKIKEASNLKEEDIPNIIYDGMTLAEKYGIQRKLNQAVLYLDNPENQKTYKTMERLRRLWDKVPGPIQWELVHNLTRNNPGYVFLRFLCKTGLLEYKRAEKITDTKTISEETRKAIMAIFKIAKIFLDELEGLDEQVAKWIMNGANFTEDIVFNAKLEVEKTRRERKENAKTKKHRFAA